MHRTWLVAALLVAASLAVGTAQALPADKHVTLEGDNGQSCASEGSGQMPTSIDCFRVVNGSLDGLEQGMRVHLKLENVGNASHNAYAAPSADADSNHLDTPADAAINNTDTIEAGENTSMIFQIPSDAEGLYIWCDIQGHEAGGMWLDASVSSPSEPTEGDGDDGNTTGDDGETSGEDDTSTIPAPGAVVLASAVALAALVDRRRRGR